MIGQGSELGAGTVGLGSPSVTDRRALAQTLAAIAVDHPEVPVEEIRELLQRKFDQTAGARIQLYRVVLAERGARLTLRRRA